MVCVNKCFTVRLICRQTDRDKQTDSVRQENLSDMLYVSDSPFSGPFPFDANFDDQDDSGDDEVKSEKEKGSKKILDLHLLISSIIIFVLKWWGREVGSRKIDG